MERLRQLGLWMDVCEMRQVKRLKSPWGNGAIGTNGKLFNSCLSPGSISGTISHTARLQAHHEGQAGWAPIRKPLGPSAPPSPTSFTPTRDRGVLQLP